MIMEEKLRILLCEDDENLGMLLREFCKQKAMPPTFSPTEKAVTRHS